MKPLMILLCLGASALATDLNALSSEAQRDYIAGRTAAAKTKFALILKSDPNNITAKSYMRMIAASEPKAGAPTLKASLDKVVLPKVSFRDASFSSALDYLKQQAGKQNAAVSFVYQVPKETLDAAQISLDLQNVPFFSALDYACQLAHLEYAVQQYAIVIRPAAPATAAAPVAGMAPPAQ